MFVTGFGQGLITAINRRPDAGWRGTIFTDTAVIDPRVKKNLASLDSIVFLGNAFDEERAKGCAAADFAAKYRNLSGSVTDEVPPQAPFAYTAAKLLVHGLAEARGSKAAVMPAIAGAKDFPPSSARCHTTANARYRCRCSSRSSVRTAATCWSTTSFGENPDP
jgi:hypothetical protein